MAKLEYRLAQRRYRAELAKRGLKLHSFIIPVVLVEEVRAYIKERSKIIDTQDRFTFLTEKV